MSTIDGDALRSSQSRVELLGVFDFPARPRRQGIGAVGRSLSWGDPLLQVFLERPIELLLSEVKCVLEHIGR
jgi:hypothetical protein